MFNFEPLLGPKFWSGVHDFFNLEFLLYSSFDVVIEISFAVVLKMKNL